MSGRCSSGSDGRCATRSRPSAATRRPCATGGTPTAPVIICGVRNGEIHRMTMSEEARGFGPVVARLRTGPPWLFRAGHLVRRSGLRL